MYTYDIKSIGDSVVVNPGPFIIKAEDWTVPVCVESIELILVSAIYFDERKFLIIPFLVVFCARVLFRPAAKTLVSGNV